MSAPAPERNYQQIALELAGARGLQLRVSGASMLPLIRPLDLVQVQPPGGMPLRPGEVAAFRLEGNVVTHRVVRVHGDTVILKGDHARGLDRPIGAGDILGRVMALGRAEAWRPWPVSRLHGWVARLSWREGRIYEGLLPPGTQAGLVRRVIARVGALPFRVGMNLFLWSLTLKVAAQSKY